jgi:hypothetical protein
VGTLVGAVVGVGRGALVAGAVGVGLGLLMRVTFITGASERPHDVNIKTDKVNAIIAGKIILILIFSPRVDLQLLGLLGLDRQIQAV